MADLSALSDEELLALYHAPKSGLAAMSDAQLLAAYAKTEGRKTNDEAGWLDNAVRTLARGATFGFADEIAAAGNATMGGLPGMGGWTDRYNQSLTDERGRDDAWDETNPVASTVGQLAGGIGGAFVAPAVAPFKAASFGANAAARLGRAGEALRPIANTAINAGLAGGVAGFGEGRDGLGERLQSAAVGGALGGVGGAAVHGAVNAGSSIAGRMLAGFGAGDAGKQADRLIAQALMRDQIPLDDLARRAALADDVTILPDLAGRNTVGLTATVANVPGRAMEMADQLIQGRRYGGPDRVASAIDTAMGGGAGGDVADVTQALIRKRAEDAAPLYQKAFDRPAGFNEPMKIVLEDPITKAGLARGLEIQRIENTTRRARGEAAVPTTDPSIHYDDLGVPRIVGVPNMRSMDAVKRGLDSIIEDARDSTTGRINWTEKLRAVDDMRRTWVGLLDHGNSDYAAARAAWGGPSSALDAVALGRKALGADRDAVAAGAAHIDPGNMPFMQLGAGRALADRLSDPATMPGQARKIIEDRQMQARLQSVLPEDMRRDFLIRALKKETDRAAVDHAISPRAGSQTARLLAGTEDAGAVPTMAAMLLTGHPFAAAGALAGHGLRRGRGISDPVSAVLAARLLGTGGDAISDTLHRVRTQGLQDAITRERNAGLARALISGGTVGAGLGVN